MAMVMPTTTATVDQARTKVRRTKTPLVSEFDMIGAREGFAHLIATLTFNTTTHNDGFVRWFNTTYDAEFNDPHLPGGRIRNNCFDANHGVATNIDSLRNYWASMSPTDTLRISFPTVLNAYSQAVQAGPLRDQYYAFIRKQFPARTAARCPSFCQRRIDEPWSESASYHHIAYADRAMLIFALDEHPAPEAARLEAIADRIVPSLIPIVAG